MHYDLGPAGRAGQAESGAGCLVRCNGQNLLLDWAGQKGESQGYPKDFASNNHNNGVVIY